MKSLRPLLLAIMAATVLLTGTARAGVLYTLRPGTSFGQGCVGPCMCPILMSDNVNGIFVLSKVQTDPLYTSYSISRIFWTVTDGDRDVIHRITGKGSYKVGGEVAVTQQLILDLSIDGGEPQHLDSGLIPGGSDFPVISVSVDRGTECYDIWMEIDAAPAKMKDQQLD